MRDTCIRASFFSLCLFPFPPRDYLFDFPGRKFFQSSRCSAFTWMCILCARRIYFYFIDERTPRSARWRLLAFGPPLLFRKPAASFVSCGKLGEEDRGRSRWQKGERSEKAELSCCCKTLGQPFRTRSPVLLPFTACVSNASMVIREINSGANIGAVISRPQEAPFTVAPPRLEAQLIANRYSWIYVSRNYNGVSCGELA